MDARTRLPGPIPSLWAVPPLISTTARTGSADAMGVRENGVVRAAIVEIVPSARTNRISSESGVSFIQNAVMTGRPKSNSMPPSAGRCHRPIRPRSREASSAAISTRKERRPCAVSNAILVRDGLAWLHDANITTTTNTKTAAARRWRTSERLMGPAACIFNLISA